ncbi:MAG: sialidase family protein, partial [Chthoniobacterales bacterium]
YLASMNEMGGGLTNRSNLFYKSTNGGATWSQVYSGPSFAAPGATTCASNSYFACMFNSPSFWRHQGWGQPAVLGNTVHYVYDARNPSNGDTGNVFYIRSTDGGSTFSAPVQLNTDSTSRPQWQPNISVGADGSLVAVWYDARESTTCTKGNTNVPCYRMWARKSTDNGATWQQDEAFSDVVTPLPNQPDPNIVTEYAGDYDYSFASSADHLHTWTDGRVAVNNSSQQDAFFDREAIGGGGGGDIALLARARSRNGENFVALRWTPADGGTMNILRNGVIVQTSADDGSTKDRLGNTSGNFTYQVCETDTGDCSNQVQVSVP